MREDILKGDPKLRSRVLALSLLGALLLLAGLYWMQSELQSLAKVLETSPEAGAERFLFLSRTLFALMATGIAGLGFYLIRSSRKALASGSFPPPGTRVLRDTPIQRGPAARTKAKLGLVLGILVLILGLWFPFHTHGKFKAFIDQQLERVNTVQRERYLG